MSQRSGCQKKSTCVVFLFLFIIFFFLGGGGGGGGGAEGRGDTPTQPKTLTVMFDVLLLCIL